MIYSIFELFTKGAVAMALDEKQIIDEQDASDRDNDTDSQNGNGALNDQQEVSPIELQRKQELALRIQEINDLKETCKSVAADFENFKKRVERDRVAWTRSSQAEVLRDLLPIVDDFDRAIAEYQKQENEASHESWIAGFELIRKALNKLLQTYGVTPIVHMTDFDPEFHEAVAHVESPTHEAGTIVDVVQKGYMFNGLVLRAARVTVAK